MYSLNTSTHSTVYDPQTQRAQSTHVAYEEK